MSIKKQAELMFSDINQSTQYKHVFKTVQSFDDPRSIAIWPVVFHYLSKDQLSKNGTPSYSESAMFYAGHLYAMSGQTATQESDAIKLSPFFKALALSDPLNDTLAKRVQLSFKTVSFESMVLSLSQFQRIMQKNNPKLIDYGQLAQDLYNMQFNYDSYLQVIRKWSQDFFTYSKASLKPKDKD